MKMLQGTQLSKNDQVKVIKRFKKMRLAYIGLTNSAWLSKTRFIVRPDGSLDGRFSYFEIAS